MDALERPRLRPIQVHSFQESGQTWVALVDPSGAAPAPYRVSLAAFQHVVRRFDGRSTLADIQAEVLRGTGQFLAMAELETLVKDLDAARLLAGPTFGAFLEEYRLQKVRPAAFAGRSYAGTARALHAQIEQYFHDPRGSGPPAPRVDPKEGDACLRGVMSPHIDFGRGGTTYTWAFRELVERSNAEIYVILGVAHQATERRFALTFKDFETPLGLARTDRDFVAEMASDERFDWFTDELAHRTEHSIEFHVVFLQHLLAGRDFSIVPILVGSFHDLMGQSGDPSQDPEVASFLERLQKAEARRPGRVTYLASVDFGHIGREFGDPFILGDDHLNQLRTFDQRAIQRAEAADSSGWFRTLAEVENRWRICGMAATYTFLEAIGPSRGRLLRYDQAVDARRTCCVSFASMAFDAVE